MNVDGAVHVMNEAIDSGVTSFTHISTGNVLLGSPNLTGCDEVNENNASICRQIYIEEEKKKLNPSLFLPSRRPGNTLRRLLALTHNPNKRRRKKFWPKQRSSQKNKQKL